MRYSVTFQREDLSEYSVVVEDPDFEALRRGVSGVSGDLFLYAEPLYSLPQLKAEIAEATIVAERLELECADLSGQIGALTQQLHSREHTLATVREELADLKQQRYRRQESALPYFLYPEVPQLYRTFKCATPNCRQLATMMVRIPQLLSRPNATRCFCTSCGWSMAQREAQRAGHKRDLYEYIVDAAPKGLHLYRQPVYAHGGYKGWDYMVALRLEDILEREETLDLREHRP